MKKILSSAVITFLFTNSFAQTGNVGIGTTLPKARLHVIDSSVLFSANSTLPATPGNPPAIGAGRRMMWYADKAAFRTGYVSGINWDKNNIGNYSFAAGNDVMASGLQSVAFGYNSQALTAESFAIGNNAVSSGLGARAMGLNVNANGDQSTAIGFNLTASGIYAVAIGANNTVNGFSGIATGSFNSASGDYSSAHGRFNKSKSYAGTVIGTYNDSTNASSSTVINNNNRLFQIGNGTADNDRSNAFTVLQNGYAGLNTATPLHPLHIINKNNTNGLFGRGIVIENTSGPITGEAAIAFKNRGTTGLSDNAAWMAGLNSFTNFVVAYGDTLKSSKVKFKIDTLGNVSINTQGTPAQSKLDVKGSIGNAIHIVTSGITLDDTHHTIIIDANTLLSPTITLPPANTCARREYRIVNRSTLMGQTSINYVGYFVLSNDLPSNSSTLLQSDGILWYKIN